MRKNKEIISENRTVPLFTINRTTIPFYPPIFTFFLIVSILFVSCKSSETSNEYKRSHDSASKVNISCCQISPDNKTLIFYYFSRDWSKVSTYDVLTDTITPLNDEVNQINEGEMYSPDGNKISYLGARSRKEPLDVYIMNADGTNRRQITTSVQALGAAFFSPDGKKLAFLGRKNSAEKYNLFSVKIDGRDLRQITMDQDVKGVPAFSPDSKKLIYKRSHLMRKRAFPLMGEMDTAWDIYEYNLESGIERRLTNYNFYEAYNPQYMSDGKRFTFSAKGPVNSKEPGPRDFEEYEKMYQKNFIFIMDGINNELKPAFTFGNNSISCYKGVDDTRLFLSEVHGKNNSKTIQELFLYKDGRIKQLTNLNSYIVTGGLSRDNSLVIFMESKDKEVKFWLMKSDGTGLKEIKIPLEKLK